MFNIVERYNRKNTYDEIDISIPIPTYNSFSNTELEILPSNYESVLGNNGLTLSPDDIRGLLLNGNITLTKSENFIPTEDSKLFLSTENITEYIFNQLAIADNKVEERIDIELSRIVEGVNSKAFLLLPFVQPNEKDNILEIYEKEIDPDEYVYDKVLNKVLSLTNKKKEFVSLVLLKNTFNKNIQKKDQTQVSNEIYLEENIDYYTSLLKYLDKRKELLISLNIYHDEYGQLIDDMRRIVEKDSTIYGKIIDLGNQYILLHTIDNNILTVSTTNNYKEYTNIDTTYISNSTRIPVLMYHQITTPPENASTFTRGLYLDPLEFERQIAYLIKNGYETISSAEFSHILQNGKGVDKKYIMLTFDDGTVSHYTNAYRILKKYGLSGTFFVVSNRSAISNQQIREMSDNGMDIQSHSKSHPNFVNLNDISKLQNEIAGSKVVIEGITDKPVISIAYPGCVADYRAFNIAAQSGYQLGFSCGKSIDHRYSNRLSLSRIHNPRNIEDLKKILSGIYPF